MTTTSKQEVARLVNPDMSRYVVSKEIATASGRKAVDINDAVAKSLRGADLSEAYRAASVATGETQVALKQRYAHLNPGMQRMNLGNLVRGAASKANKPAKKAPAKKAAKKAPSKKAATVKAAKATVKAAKATVKAIKAKDAPKRAYNRKPKAEAHASM